jgi:hypothetical protein
MALFSRIKTWVSLEKLYASDLNAEFNNLLAGFTPTKIEGASSTLANMQAIATPGTVGSESLAGDLQTEIRQLRYMLKALSGEAYWYAAPSKTLATLNTNVAKVPVLAEWNLNGLLASGITLADVDNGFVVPVNMNIVGIAISVMTKETAYVGPGTPVLAVDIYKVASAGGAPSAIFSTSPKFTVATSNLDYAYYSFESSSLITPPSAPGTFVTPVLATTTLNAGTMLTMSFSYAALSTGANAAGLKVQLVMKPS